MFTTIMSMYSKIKFLCIHTTETVMLESIVNITTIKLNDYKNVTITVR